MINNIIIFEGFDGSGKGTLIEMFINYFSNKSVRIVGRKNEDKLKGISDLIENNELLGFSDDTEFLLRISLEVERQKLIDEIRNNYDIIIVDRAYISLSAWADYYSLNRSKYIPILNSIENFYEGASLVFCSCRFETCWQRVIEKKTISKKEKKGKAINEIFFTKYMKLYHNNKNAKIIKIEIDTENVLPDSSFTNLLQELNKF